MTQVQVIFGGRAHDGELLEIGSWEAIPYFKVRVLSKQGDDIGVFEFWADDIISSPASLYARELNAETRRWISEDPENRAAGMLAEDASHWAGYGIITVQAMGAYFDRELEKDERKGRS